MTHLVQYFGILLVSLIIAAVHRWFPKIPLFVVGAIGFGLGFLGMYNTNFLICAGISLLPLYPLPLGMWIRGNLDIYSSRWFYLVSIVGLTVLVVGAAYVHPGFIFPFAIALCIVGVRFVQWQEELNSISRREMNDSIASVLKGIDSP